MPLNKEIFISYYKYIINYLQLYNFLKYTLPYNYLQIISSGDLGSVDYLFIAITPKSTLTWSFSA